MHRTVAHPTEVQNGMHRHRPQEPPPLLTACEFPSWTPRKSQMSCSRSPARSMSSELTISSN